MWSFWGAGETITLQIPPMEGPCWGLSRRSMVVDLAMVWELKSCNLTMCASKAGKPGSLTTLDVLTVWRRRWRCSPLLTEHAPFFTKPPGLVQDSSNAPVIDGLVPMRDVNPLVEAVTKVNALSAYPEDLPDSAHLLSISVALAQDHQIRDQSSSQSWRGSFLVGLAAITY